ncbi:MAG: hypothetical protein ACKJSK_16705 [Roseibacillus sp.]
MEEPVARGSRKGRCDQSGPLPLELTELALPAKRSVVGADAQQLRVLGSVARPKPPRKGLPLPQRGALGFGGGSAQQ